MTDALLNYSNQLADIVAAATPSIVQVQGRRRPASGVVFGDGLVLTTTRALGREDGLHVRTDDGRSVEAELIGWHAATSLVVLRAANLNSPTLAPAEVSARVGHVVLALGRSWSGALTATNGVVSVIGGPLPTGRGRSIDRVIRTTAQMHGGFAGGALIDMTGRALGIATATEIRGLGVVIPADIAWATAKSLAEHGSIQHGYLGVAGQPVRLPERQRQADGPTHALLVVGVSSGSPADAGGILIGDVVIAFNGHAVQSPVDVLELLQSRRVGEHVTLRVLRGGEARDIDVTIGDRPAR